MSRNRVLALYKQMLRESEKFTNYNFRKYAGMRVKDAFREGRTETDPTKVQSLLSRADDNLAMIKRQVVLGDLYRDRNAVIEGMPSA